MNMLQTHAVIGPFALLVPWITAMIVRRVVRREGLAAPPSVRPLATATLIALVAFCSWLVVDATAIAAGERQLALATIEIGGTLAIFAFFTLPILSAMNKAVAVALTEREERVRSASVAPRYLSMYVPASWRAAAILPIAALLVFATVRASSGAFPLLSIGFSFAAVVFFFLYEAWMRQETSGVRAMDDDNRRRRIRRVFLAQTTLTASLLALAVLPAGIIPPPLVAIAGGAIGVAGCALALSTGAQERFVRHQIARQ